MADGSAQVPLLVEGSSSSEPVPVPGSHAFSISVRLRDRIVPESPANQSSGQPGASSSADTDNEMQAVEARYTDCVGRQDLLGSTQELYRLVARLAGFASGSDPHPFTREEAAGAARCIDLFVMETASDSSARSSSLSTTAEDLSLHRFYAAIGDHAGVLCEALRNAKDAPLLQRPWTIILPELESEERRLTAWEASSRDVPRPRTPYTDALEARVETLFAQGMTDLDTDLALFAVRTYVKRNSLFHGRTYDLFKCGRFAQLADQLDLDDENLAGLLPDKEKPLVDKYRRLIRFNKESRICTDDAGNWVKRKAPPPEVPDKFVPPTFRRHTVSDDRGIKRPAEEQPPGQPRVKAARGLDYDVTAPNAKVETVENHLSDEGNLGIARSLADLYDLADQLAREAPSEAQTTLGEQVSQLKQKLKRVRAALDKKRYEKERSQREPRGPGKNNTEEVSAPPDWFLE